jgi:hypothetical protein
MTDVGSTLLNKARISVKKPDTSPGTTGGVGASYGLFGKGFSFEGYVPDASGNKKYVSGLPSLGVTMTVHLNVETSVSSSQDGFAKPANRGQLAFLSASLRIKDKQSPGYQRNIPLYRIQCTGHFCAQIC